MPVYSNVHQVGWLALFQSCPFPSFLWVFSMLAAQYAIEQQWVGAVISFWVVLMFAVNVMTYNISGILLIRILRKHQDGTTATADDISGSKSASPFDIVIMKTTRSLILLSLPSVAALMLFLFLGIQSSNINPMAIYNPNAPAWSVFFTFFLQIILGLLFTRATWITKTALNAEVVVKAVSGSSTQSTERRSTRTASPGEKKDRTQRLSQSPKQSSRSEEDQAPAGVEMQQSSATESCASVAIAVNENTN